MSRLIVYTSLTGNTKTFADYLYRHTNDEATISMDNSKSISDYEKIVIGTYSWGNGKIPRKLKKYLIENKDSFKSKDVFVFGSGNSIYPKFCGAVDGVKKIVGDCGANIISEFRFEQRFNETDLTLEEKEQLNNFISKWNG